ncbi:hypothetical protein E2562_010062 [Oryza meyeriana var. granulata]|uniref:Mei2-like C-terminal RNA recognition motif domain-containing protein n=1 Tax=Oryza meyeriana var. granulata TaxID=110450 RepID=A0A6G1EI23_9ORYZ|nr:hypothetical protein E2562_010062 [Oryza meyeriana var. granulata]
MDSSCLSRSRLNPSAAPWEPPLTRGPADYPCPPVVEQYHPPPQSLLPPPPVCSGLVAAPSCCCAACLQHFVPVGVPVFSQQIAAGRALHPPLPPVVAPVMIVYCLAPPTPAAAPATRCRIEEIEDGDGGGGVESAKVVAGDEPYLRAVRGAHWRKAAARLMAILDQHCHDENGKLTGGGRRVVKSEYDFLYVPIDFRTGYNKGYAFVNMTTATAARRLRTFLQNHRWDAAMSGKVCDVVPAAIQGRDAFLTHFSASCFACRTRSFLPVWFEPPRDGVQQTKEHVVGRLVVRPR